MPEPTAETGWVPIPNNGAPAGDRVTQDQIGNDNTWPMQSSSGPCRTWPIEPGCSCLPPDAGSLTPEQAHAVESATEILWRLTGGRFGLCREIVRPCRRGCLPNDCGDWPEPALIGGTWVNVYCTSHRGNPCGCTWVDEIALPGPVYWEAPEVTLPAGELPAAASLPERRYDLRVYIDGKPLNTSQGAYWALDNNRLFRTDGGKWPACQDLTRPLTDEGTFGVIYWRGRPVPAGGRRAVSLLACELWKACAGNSDCKLPARVQQVQREGVTMTMVDSQEFLDKGRTGITEVDLWLSAVNPHGRRQPATVYSPDGPSVRSEWTTGKLPPKQDRW